LQEGFPPDEDERCQGAADETMVGGNLLFVVRVNFTALTRVMRATVPIPAVASAWCILLLLVDLS